MVEVFKTNVTSHTHASWLINQIHNAFPDYNANFDLTDCDRILRVKSTGCVQSELLIHFLRELTCLAEILPDEVVTTEIHEYIIGEAVL